MGAVAFEIIRGAVLQAPGVEAEPGIMAEEQRAAVFHPEREGDAVVFLAVVIIIRGLVGGLIAGAGDGIGRRGCGEHIGDQRLVEALDPVVHLPAVIPGPVPVEGIRPALGVPGPFDLLPEPVAARGKERILVTEPLAGRQQPLDHEGRLNQVPAVIVFAETERVPAVGIVPVGPGAMETLELFQRRDHAADARDALLAGEICALGAGDDGHHAEAGTADGDDVPVAVVVPLPRKARGRVGEIGEVLDRIALDRVQQGLVRQGRAPRFRAACQEGQGGEDGKEPIQHKRIPLP